MGKTRTPPIAVAIHGGSGTILRKDLPDALEASYREALAEAREAAWEILMGGGDALDAVEAGACVLEDCPLFNAGRGSVLTADGTHELDASVMCGRECRAGAVTGLSTVRHPVSLARMVMEKSGFVFLSGAGAEAFADTTGLERVSSDWFTTPGRLEQLEKARARESVVMDHDKVGDEKFGTIGVVALDKQGNLAAATSTGGLTNKRYGRIGDSPVIGAGTYADNRTCAVSCTGYGEEFIRSVVAYDLSARMEYLKESLAEAARQIVHRRLPIIGGSGGLVAVDRDGHVTLPFNTQGMYRAWRSSIDGEGIAIYADA
jgi:beta-aspartyl-peptidase (threonine type)